MKLFKLINFTKSYDLIWLVITPFVPLLIFYRIIIGKEEILRIKERFGYPSTTRNKKDKLIWLHAASLGEVASATSLAIGFKKANYKGLILIRHRKVVLAVLCEILMIYIAFAAWFLSD